MLQWLKAYMEMSNMINKFFCYIFFLFLPAVAVNAKFDDDQVSAILNAHYAAYHDKEYFSGIALSVYAPGQAIKSYYTGKVSHEEGSKNIDAYTLFEIGSITKSFTAAIVLQLEKENKLHLTDTVEKGFPEYSKWSMLTIKSLLNMTSGLPNYTDAPLMNAEQFYHPEKLWTDKDLLQFVYPKEAFSPPLKSGYAYTNTGYILTAMMIEKATQHSFKTEIEYRLIQVAKLENTFYPLPAMDKNILSRLAHGYGYNQYANPESVGEDVQKSNLSWAGAAGAVVSNSSDVIKWIKALFIDHKILDEKQKHDMMQLVSTATGKPIDKSSEKSPHSFGLGVTQGYDKDMGEFWFYEGETEGFRALYMYVPSNGIIISSMFNSAVNSENDHAGELMKKIYALIKKK